MGDLPLPVKADVLVGQMLPPRWVSHNLRTRQPRSVGSLALMPRRLAPIVLALVLASTAPAFGDGDPASDVLPSQDAYYPYQPPVSKDLVTALNAELKQVRKGGYPIKVALIQTAGDMGSLSQLFNDPQRYTNVLASELPSNPHGSVKEALHLLVVMPGGFGGQNLGDKVNTALAPVKINTAEQSDGLARAALEAVARVATANGVKTAVPKEASASSDSGGGGGGPSAIVFVILGVVIVGLIVGLVLVRRRGAEAPGPETPPETQETP